jgi:uncharacterized damage-inducible protein DinB
MKGRLWLCLPAVAFCLIDATLTLLGQDREYWAGELARVNELNPLGWWLLRWHPLCFVAGIALWIAMFCVALLRLPPRAAVPLGLGLAVGHTFGAATWLVRWESPYAIGMVAGVVLLVTADHVTWTCWKRFRGHAAADERKAGMKIELERLFAYDAWANREMAQALRSAATPPARAMQLLAHIGAGQRVWLGRLQQDPGPEPVWPELSLDQCDAAFAELGQRWQKYFLQVSDADLLTMVTYTTSAGETWTNTVEDILRHLALHGCYHRGQIATYLRQAGLVVGNTDYIFAVRQGFVD